MKNFKSNIIFILLIFVLSINVKSLLATDCCNHLVISTEIVDSCGVKICIYNPYCDGQPLPLIHFTQYNSETRMYEVKESINCPKESTVCFIFYPINGETEVKYRLLVDSPECVTDYIEGQTMFTGTVDLSSCCSCPENPEERNNWVTVEVHKDPSCPNAGCEVTMNLNNMPDSITCFKYYMFEDIYGNDTPISSIAYDPISELSYCLNAGQSGYIYVFLLQHQDQAIETGCIIEKFVSCDSTTNADTVPQPCTIDCLDDLWHEPEWQPITLDNGCVLNVLYTWRLACQEQYQDLQILEVKYNSNCSYLTKEQIFQKAVEGLISSNPMNFHPRLGDTTCYYTWRITIISCWRVEVQDDYPGFMMWPCPGGCCYQVLKVCRSLLNVVTITPIGPTVIFEPPNGCEIPPDPPSYYDPNKCYAICSWISISGEVQPMGEMLRHKDNPSEISAEGINLNGRYIEGILNLSLKSNCGELLRVDISDVYGIKWISYEQLSKSEKINFKIDTRSLERGYYVYKIFCNGNFVGNGKFVVE
ncbi:MAG: hypothetical protein A2X61_05730 [Ignavibacteria bacterium GWB2_35_12]|nr:MAG: hypothetical protein A2X63_07105 [Ignavibacteria bacterium GWA2_35_8]OGU42253.1 MAG: hypothetical protein A2X61_05730 [Ignavibacteria bacterium GWB2_35_12]OGU93518.1 MAG: hypothetical protein A2220_13000 [Ignavibacteria bacterium RIFOXYA2_FULL_35_10]OGV20052.1 MAG: hypothetical protein A2475_04525 [Ignavibacteria bacterium RIFOXYC2_FULL_35_21]